MATLPQQLGPWRLGEALAKPGAGVACIAGHAEYGTPALGLVIPAPARRDIVCDRLFHHEWTACRLEALEEVCTLHHAELRPGDDGSWYYAAVVEPYHPAHTIDRFIARNGPLTPLNALRFLKIVARALVGLEQRRLHHGYLTPQQVVLDRHGRPRLTHPLVARAERSRVGFEQVPHGFVAPELLAGGEPSMASDCYAAGALLHLVATGKPPMAGLDISEFHPELLAAMDTDPGSNHRALDPAVLDVVRRAMAVRPAERIASAIELLHAVERAQKAVVETQEGFDPVEDDALGGTSAWCRPAGSGEYEVPSAFHRRRARSGSGVRPPRTGRAARAGSGVRSPRTGRHRRGEDERALEPTPIRRRQRGVSPLLWLYLVAVAAALVVAGLGWMVLQGG